MARFKAQHRRQNQRRSVFLVAVMTAVSVICSPLVSQSAAAPTACGTGGNFFEGYRGFNTSSISYHNTPIGVSGHISTPPLPGFCVSGRPGDLFSLSWVMLYDDGTKGLGQAGIAVEISQPGQGPGVPAPNCSTTFYEWHHDGSSGMTPPGGGRIDDYPNCAAVGSTYTFRVLSVGTSFPEQGNYQLALQVGAGVGAPSTVYQTSWNRDLWTKINPQFFSETNNTGVDIMGKPSSRAVLSELGIQSADGSGLIYVPCYMYSITTAARGNLNAPSCTKIETWSS